MEGEAGSIIPVLVVSISPIFVLLSILISAIIYKKYGYQMKPVHVFLINFFGVLALHLLFTFSVVAIFKLWPLSGDMCVHYSGTLVTTVWFCLSIIIMQVDRFTAIHWDIKYKTYATAKAATCVCIFNFLISLVLVISMVHRYSAFMNCTATPSLIYTRSPMLILGGVMKMISLLVTLLVSFYVLKTKKRLQNQVHPSLPLSQVPQAQEPHVERIPNVRRLNSQPHLFFCTDQSRTVNTSSPNMIQEEDNFIFLTVKKTTTMNLLALLFAIEFLPDVVLGLVFFNCEHNDSDCAQFLLWFLPFGLVKSISLLVVIIVALKRLLTKQNDESLEHWRRTLIISLKW